MTAPRPAVRVATADDAPAIVRTLVRAFADDPFVRWIVRPGGGEELLRSYMDMALRRMTMPHGAVYTTDDLRAVALWAPPGTWDLSVGDQLALLPTVLRIVGVGRLPAVAQGIGEIEAGRPEPPWWFLTLLGTEPAAQRTGLGSAVLRPVLERCDREGIPAVLDTCVESNLRFYARHGFRVSGRIQLPAGGPPCWSLVRSPAAR